MITDMKLVEIGQKFSAIFAELVLFWWGYYVSLLQNACKLASLVLTAVSQPQNVLFWLKFFILLLSPGKLFRCVNHLLNEAMTSFL